MISEEEEGGGEEGGGGSGIQSITMDGGFPNKSQGFSGGDSIFDDLNITKIEENFGVLVKIFFDSEVNRDAFLSSVSSWSMGGVEMNVYIWTDEDTDGFGLVSSDALAVAEFAVGTRDFEWTLI